MKSTLFYSIFGFSDYISYHSDLIIRILFFDFESLLFNFFCYLLVYFFLLSILFSRYFFIYLFILFYSLLFIFIYFPGGILLFSKEAIINFCKNAGLSDISSGLIGGFGGGVAQVSVLGPCTFLVTASVTGANIIFNFFILNYVILNFLILNYVILNFFILNYIISNHIILS